MLYLGVIVKYILTISDFTIYVRWVTDVDERVWKGLRVVRLDDSTGKLIYSLSEPDGDNDRMVCEIFNSL